jgi:hypothetical protein
MCGMSIASVKQSLMDGVALVHRISCTAIEPRHGRGGTAQHQDFEVRVCFEKSSKTQIGLFKSQPSVNVQGPVLKRDPKLKYLITRNCVLC